MTGTIDNAVGDANTTARRIVSPASERSWRAVWRQPLPWMKGEPLTRLGTRALVGWTGQRIIEIEGLEKVDPKHDPFILVLNHTIRPEALIVPAALLFHRGGKRLHFIADWNSLLLPGVAWFMRRSRVIVLVKKDARPKFLNVLKPLYRSKVPPFEQARQILAAGGVVGIFPEAKAHLDPVKMLPGSPGAARLSLETGVPVVPVGISFPEHRGLLPVSKSEKMRVVIGDKLHPKVSSRDGRVSTAAVREWHAEIMTTVARLAGKQWQSRGAENLL
jgi:1-acyl-sn-glycerol-3-phosphate acyltransferase